MAASFNALRDLQIAQGAVIESAIAPVPQTYGNDAAIATALTQGTAPGEGYASFSLALPTQSSFVGVSIFGQWLVVDPLGPNGFGSSNAFGFTMF